jgi:hypothetical protein
MKWAWEKTYDTRGISEANTLRRCALSP